MDITFQAIFLRRSSLFPVPMRNLEDLCLLTLLKIRPSANIQPKTNKWIPQNKANTQIFFFTCFTYAKLPFFEYDAIHVRCKKYSFLGLFWAPSPAEKNLAEIFWENTKPRPQNKPHWEFQQQARKSTPGSYGSRVRSISTAFCTKKIQPPHSQSHAGRTCLATTYRRTAVNAMVRFMRRGTGNVGWP